MHTILQQYPQYQIWPCRVIILTRDAYQKLIGWTLIHFLKPPLESTHASCNVYNRWELEKSRHFSYDERYRIILLHCTAFITLRLIIIIYDIYIAPYSGRSCFNALYNTIIPDSDLFPPSTYLNSKGCMLPLKAQSVTQTHNHLVLSGTHFPYG